MTGRQHDDNLCRVGLWSAVMPDTVHVSGQKIMPIIFSLWHWHQLAIERVKRREWCGPSNSQARLWGSNLEALGPVRAFSTDDLPCSNLEGVSANRHLGSQSGIAPVVLVLICCQ